MSARDYGDRVRARLGAGPAYLSFDIDVLDPASRRVPERRRSRACSLARRWASCARWRGSRSRGFDVVEVAPPYDSPGQVTALNAAAVAYDLLALLAVARRG